MDNVCLKTALNAAVNNDNLPVFGQIKIKIIDMNKYNNALATQKKINGTTSTVVDNEVIADNKYKITQIHYYGRKMMVEVNLDELKYCEKLSYLNCATQQIVGDMKNLPISIERLCCGSMTAPITDIAHLVSLTEVIITSSNTGFKLTGNIEDFVTGQIQNGRESCTDLVFGNRAIPNLYINNGLYYNGSALSGRAKSLSWNWDGTSANIVITTL